MAANDKGDTAVPLSGSVQEAAVAVKGAADRLLANPTLQFDHRISHRRSRVDGDVRAMKRATRVA
jgi:hypothetical protein